MQINSHVNMMFKLRHARIVELGPPVGASPKQAVVIAFAYVKQSGHKK